MESLYEETFRNFEEGTIVEGRIVAIGKDKIVVDIGYKSEGLISLEQFSQEELSHLKIDDRVQVYIEDTEDSEGNLVLSKEKADKMKIWEDLEKIFKEEKNVEGKILSKIKGGMMVDIGVKAFLPGSQIDLHPVRDLDGLIGKVFPMKIIKVQEGEKKIGLSIKAVKADEYAQDFQAFRQSSGSDRSTLGDVFRAAQKAARKESEKESEEE